MSRNRSILFSLFVAAAFCSPVLAAGDGEAASPFAGDLGNAVWTLVIFLLVLFVLGKWVWGPILKGLQSREEFIARSLHDADEANRTAQQKLDEYREQLEKARAEASAIVEEGRRDAEVVRRSLQDEARQEADAMIERAKREITLARDSALRDLYDLGARLATDTAGKIIAKELSAADHERLIRESIAELGNVDAGRN